MHDGDVAADHTEGRGHVSTGNRSANGPRYWIPAPDSICAHLEVGTGAPHLHEEWQFGVPSRPAALLIGAYRRFLAGADEVTVVEPYHVHGESAGGSWIVLYLARDVVARHFHDRRLPPLTSRVAADCAAGVELRALVQNSDDGLIPGTQFQALALAWLERLARAQASSPGPRPHRSRPAVDRVRAHLHVRPTEPVTLAEVALVAGVAASRLVRSFSQEVGLPPRSYHAQTRLALARRLLAEGKPATWVAYECGFADQSHLSRRFKEYYGLTPGSFLAQCRARHVTEPGSDAA